MKCEILLSTQKSVFLLHIDYKGKMFQFISKYYTDEYFKHIMITCDYYKIEKIVKEADTQVLTSHSTADKSIKSHHVCFANH